MQLNKETNMQSSILLIDNGAFLPDDINDTRFNPPLHYCPGLEWAYDAMKRLQEESSSAGESSSYSSG
ncbi:Phytochrome-interacting ankyrin-repeat protein [Thalictrum thalictroides]|uniref:Phytochrome-interacting ankyrin-repeat protein n=1 Tax=Thalictrum thalictroides TaxID=46969 RepID=A0A7J6XDZ5_THATH|nr:Phytochrome-interacting ankyrin-repeat protein [Thalictrum thalictroides]